VRKTCRIKQNSMPYSGNAVLHWIKRADSMIAGVYRSLKQDGRFTAECGGDGCINKMRRSCPGTRTEGD
jgi:hypothetical protein